MHSFHSRHCLSISSIDGNKKKSICFLSRSALGSISKETTFQIFKWVFLGETRLEGSLSWLFGLNYKWGASRLQRSFFWGSERSLFNRDGLASSDYFWGRFSFGVWNNPVVIIKSKIENTKLIINRIHLILFEKAQAYFGFITPH